MARKDLAWFKFYPQDFMTDEKLMECSASAVGVYIKIMCVLSKSNPYGKFLLKQKDKQHDKQIKNFAYKFAKHLPWGADIILLALDELITEEVLIMDGDSIYQKRMVNDGELSIKRSESGHDGGIQTQKNLKNLLKQNLKQTSDSDSDFESDSSKGIERGVGKGKGFKTMPVGTDKIFDGLPKDQIQSAIEIIKITQQVDITESDVVSLWSVFKTQNLKGSNYYQNIDKVYNHFNNWAKTQKFSNAKQSITNNGQKLGTSEARIAAIKEF